MKELTVGGERVVLCGAPDLGILEEIIVGPGDLWHSGLLRGYAGLLPELKYWSPVYWYYLNDTAPDVRNVSWRVEYGAFAVRASVWEAMGGLDTSYTSRTTPSLDLGFKLIQNGGVPLHVPDLYPSVEHSDQHFSIPRPDVYLFFTRHFKRDYQLYMLLREVMTRRRPLAELRALRWAERQARSITAPQTITMPPRPLQPLTGRLRVSAIVPTMRRQAYTANLLADYTRQTLPLHEVFVVDATPDEERAPGIYSQYEQSLPLRVIWQRSLGTCRARNEAIKLCTGDYILFADDDTRVPPDFVENHVRVLDTYQAQATNGLDIRADHPTQDLDDLARKLAQMEGRRQRVGVSENFNNANSCVRLEWVHLCTGNDVNFDGGYGEDGDFGHCLIERGAVVLYNPYSANLHLKPPTGGFRWWGAQAGKKGRSRKRQPWELKRRVGWIAPRPSPTIMYSFLKHYTKDQLREWLYVYLLRSWMPVEVRSGRSKPGQIWVFLRHLLSTPARLVRIWISYRFARDLAERGPIFE